MTPAKQGSYRFRKESIAEMRQRLGLSQSAMASMLDLPKNTVSRWERGETTPDAESLAAVYSLGKDKGVAAEFFVPVKQKAAVRDVALVYWDIRNVWFVDMGMFLEEAAQSLGMILEEGLARLDALITNEVRKRVPKATRELFKAFVNRSSAFPKDLRALGWRVWEPGLYDADWEENLYDQALSDAGQNPSGSVVFLITADAAYVDLIEDLRARDVRVYLMTTRSASAPPELMAAVGKRRWIELA